MEQKSYDIKVEITLAITTQDIEDLMSCAMEGGINYWAGLDNGEAHPEWAEKPKGMPLSTYAAHILMDGKSVFFYDIEDDDEKRWELTLEKLFAGIRQYVSDNADIVEDGKLDMCNVDGEAADMIVQYALFNEIVYG